MDCLVHRLFCATTDFISDHFADCSFSKRIFWKTMWRNEQKLVLHIYNLSASSAHLFHNNCSSTWIWRKQKNGTIFQLFKWKNGQLIQWPWTFHYIQWSFIYSESRTKCCLTFPNFLKMASNKFIGIAFSSYCDKINLAALPNIMLK